MAERAAANEWRGCCGQQKLKIPEKKKESRPEEKQTTTSEISFPNWLNLVTELIDLIITQTHCVTV